MHSRRADGVEGSDLCCGGLQTYGVVARKSLQQHTRRAFQYERALVPVQEGAPIFAVTRPKQSVRYPLRMGTSPERSKSARARMRAARTRPRACACSRMQMDVCMYAYVCAGVCVRVRVSI